MIEEPQVVVVSVHMVRGYLMIIINNSSNSIEPHYVAATRDARTMILRQHGL